MRLMGGFLAVSGAVWLAGPLVRRLGILWLLAVSAGFALLSAGSGPSFAAAGAAMLFVTIAFAAWLLFPLIAVSDVADRAPRPRAHR